MSNQIEDKGEDLLLATGLNKNAHGINIPETTSQVPKEEIPEDMRGRALTAEEMQNLAEKIKESFRKDSGVKIAVRKEPVKDFSNLGQDSIYDPDIFMEAKPFFSGDPLRIVLKDTNYEPRWVSKNSQRLGYMKSIGFTYVLPEDLSTTLELDIELDANGHYSFHDVVLMRVPKNTYYPALRAAHERAKAVVSHKKAAENGKNWADGFMQGAKDDNGQSVSGDYSEAMESGKLKFYN